MNTKRIFLASSSELKEEREQFEIFINRKNKDWVDKGVFLELILWEDFLDAVAQTRLQDEYNKAIRDCDIFVMLFWTKVGQYTDEEFETALAQFKATNKPLIFTYFKDIEISVASANKKELMSLWAFQDKLSTFGHFYTVYKNVDDLKLKFNQQLDKLASEFGVNAPSLRDPSDLGIARMFQARARAFTDEYLVSETGPVPFGGRDNELRRLDEWLLDPRGAPRMLVTAPAGRGKSALLVRWMKNLLDGGVCGSDDWQLAFMPISIRIGTNRPEVFYEGLARRLAEIAGEELPSVAIREIDGFRYAVRDFLDRIATDERRVVIVIDGLDEALQGSFDPAILPAVMPPHLRVLLSARWQVGDGNSSGWLRRLGWDRGVKARSFELDRLRSHDIADVLVKFGAPFDIIACEPGLVDTLADLTEGEPLLVRFYAEDLWGLVTKGAAVTRADLEMLKPGFDSYFERWFELQERLWRQEDAGVHSEDVDKILAVLAYALGPLEQADLLAIVNFIYPMKDVLTSGRLLEPLRRFVFGRGTSGEGYVLSHPKIGLYLQTDRFASVAVKIRRDSRGGV